MTKLEKAIKRMDNNDLLFFIDYNERVLMQVDRDHVKCDEIRKKYGITLNELFSIYYALRDAKKQRRRKQQDRAERRVYKLPLKSRLQQYKSEKKGFTPALWIDYKNLNLYA